MAATNMVRVKCELIVGVLGLANDSSYCMAPDGTEVSIVAEGTETEEHTEATEHAHTTGKKGQNCHYHGNVL